MQDPLDSALHASAKTVTPLSRSEEKKWVAAWTDIYCQPVFRSLGRIDALPSRWETFLLGARSLEGPAALDAFSEQLPAELVVFKLSGRGGAFLIHAQDVFVSPGGLDVFLFPPSLQWTVVFTHEELHGPYYSEADWCVDPP